MPLSLKTTLSYKNKLENSKTTFCDLTETYHCKNNFKDIVLKFFMGLRLPYKKSYEPNHRRT